MCCQLTETGQARREFQPPLLITPDRLLKSSAPLDIDEILRDYEYEPDLVPNDCESLLHAQSRPGYHLDEDRLTAIQSHPRFVAALRLDTPSLLLVNANADTFIASEMSIVSAKVYHQVAELAASQQEAEHTTVIPLAFFCSQHSDYRRDVNGQPSELVMSLVLQLLDRYRDFSEDDVTAALDELRPDDVPSICSALEILLSCLPNNVIVIAFIDGITAFEHPMERRDAMMEAVEQLLRVHAKERPAVVKLVFASSSRAASLQQLFTEDEVLNLPRIIPGGKGGGYLTSTWAWRIPVALEGPASSDPDLSD